MAAQNRRKAEAEEARKGSSSDEEEEEEESTEENEDLVEESDTESEGDKSNQPTPKKQLNSLPHHSSSDGDTESDSEIDLQSNAVRKLAPEVKPVSSKTMAEPSQASKKARSKPATDAQPSGASSKRPADSPVPQKGRDSKRAKKKEQDPDEAVEDEKKTGDDTKKQLFQRFWSEDDELAILKGLIQHAENQGTNPASADMTSFYDFIRKSLHIDASKNQLTEKLRRLKKKYLTNLKKSKNGDDRTFSKAHDQTSYDLSKKIWGIQSNGSLGADSVKVDKKGTKANANVKKANASVKKPNLGSPNLEKSLPTEKAKELKNMDMEVDQAVAVAATPSRAEPFYSQTVDSSMEKEIKNYRSQLITGAKKVALEGKFKQLQMKEIEVYLQRLEYMRDEATLVLEALKSSAH